MGFHYKQIFVQVCTRHLRNHVFLLSAFEVLILKYKQVNRFSCGDVCGPECRPRYS
jgi:hypothetical protein